jgi:hypothetical protein
MFDIFVGIWQLRILGCKHYRLFAGGYAGGGGYMLQATTGYRPGFKRLVIQQWLTCMMPAVFLSSV